MDHPSLLTCENVYQGLIDKCAFNSSFNAGSVNVLEMPDWGSKGVPVEGATSMWIVAPERLTLY